MKVPDLTNGDAPKAMEGNGKLDQPIAREHAPHISGTNVIKQHMNSGGVNKGKLGARR